MYCNRQGCELQMNSCQFHNPKQVIILLIIHLFKIPSSKCGLGAKLVTNLSQRLINLLYCDKCTGNFINACMQF